MKIRNTEIATMVAKIEFMQSRSVLISEADQRFFDRLKAKLLRSETEITKRDLSRYERILALDETHRVHAVRAGDNGFARGLKFIETVGGKGAAAKPPPHDPFADIGKKVPASRPKGAARKGSPQGKKERVSA